MKSKTRRFAAAFFLTLILTFGCAGMVMVGYRASQALPEDGWIGAKIQNRQLTVFASSHSLTVPMKPFWELESLLRQYPVLLIPRWARLGSYLAAAVGQWQEK